MDNNASTHSASSSQSITGFPDLVTMINEALLEKKAENLMVMDVRKVTTLADFFVICHGGSDIQVKALANHVIEKIKEQTGERVWRKEGLTAKKWVVLDYVDVVVHIFDAPSRNFYGLEAMWSDAIVTPVKD